MIQARPRRAARLVLRPGMTPEQAMRRMAGAGLRQFEVNRQGALESDDPELVHQMRVALRRLRTALRIFHHTSADQAQHKWDTALRALARVLGVQRDWDVFAAEILPEWHWGEPARAAVQAALDQRRVRTNAEITSARTRVLVSELKAWLAEPGEYAGKAALRDYAGRRLEQLEAQALNASKPRTEPFAKLGDRQRHHARIRIKLLRYAAEAFGTLFDAGRVTPYTELLRQLQESLGKLTDIKSAQTILGKLAVEKAERNSARKWLRHQKAKWLEQAAADFARARAASAFWRHNRTGESHV